MHRFVIWATDVNYVVLKNLYDEMKEHMDFS